MVDHTEPFVTAEATHLEWAGLPPKDIHPCLGMGKSGVAMALVMTSSPVGLMAFSSG